MTKLLLTVSLLLTALACDGSGDPTSEADASPDSLTQVRADGGVDLLPATKTDTLPSIKTDAQETHATSCPTPNGVAPTKGYLFTTGTVGCKDPFFSKYIPDHSCSELTSGDWITDYKGATGACCIGTTHGSSVADPKDPLIVDLINWTSTSSGTVYTTGKYAEPLCYIDGIMPLHITDWAGKYALCSVDGRFLGWSCS